MRFPTTPHDGGPMPFQPVFDMSRLSFWQFTAIYALAAFFFVWPPQGLEGLGWSIDGMFGSQLGNPRMYFLRYHIRRTVFSLATHATLVLVYCLAFIWWNPMLFERVATFAAPDTWGETAMLLAWAVAIVVANAGLFTAWLWRRHGWAEHPVCRRLATYQPQLLAAYPPHERWQHVANVIDAEFRRVDKVLVQLAHRQIAITDSWIIQTGMYSMDIARQPDVDLSIVGSQEIASVGTSIETSQILQIQVTSVHPGTKPFVLRLDSLCFREVEGKLQTRVRNAQATIIHLSLGDRFLQALKDTVAENEKYAWSETDNCAGCMTAPASVKIATKCIPHEGREPCTECFCRPMWCLECLGKWFASSQDQHRPETWLGGTGTCPTCRAVFCVYDICEVVRTE